MYRRAKVGDEPGECALGDRRDVAERVWVREGGFGV